MSADQRAGGRTYRFLATPRWLGLLGAALALGVVCVLLGRWQLARLDSRHATNDLLARNAAARPVPPADLLAVGRDPDPSRQYSRVRATGRYDAARQLLVRNRPFEGQVGYYVLTPLVTEAGPALLVNRGWVPAGETAATPADVPAPPSGTVTITARVRPAEPRSTTGPPPEGQVTRIDVPDISKSLPYETYGGYGDLVTQRPAARTAPELIPEPQRSEGPHLAYAFQWFLFGGLALGGYGLLARREAEDRAEASNRAARASGTTVVRVAG